MSRAVLDRPALAQAAEHFVAAHTLSRAHASIAADALRLFGDHGPQVSGVVRGHFPEPIKVALRALCDAMNNASAAAWMARPRGVRNATMRELSRAIRARDGGGFYL